MLEPWDETYYTGIIKSSAYDVDPSVSFESNEVSFTLI